MIHTNRVVTVGDQESIIDRPIVLYRGDREVEIEFELIGNEYMFSTEGNVIKSVNASHGQLVLNTPSGENMFSELEECHEGKVIFVVTKEMIDEFIEIGFYSFQIRLYDSAEMKSRVTIPPVMNGFDIRNPIAAEDETNVVDQGIVDYARIFKDQSDEELPTFDWQGNYNKTEWVHHDVITENKLNKIEDALYSINANIKESDVVMLNTLDQVKTDVQQFKIDTNAAINTQLEYIENNKVFLRVIKPSYTTEQIQEILNTNHNGILHVVFSKGSYDLSTLRIKKNTHILFDEAIINVTSKRLFHNFESRDEFTGYDGNGNIVIEGGIVNGHLISMIHGKNITIKNVTMKNNPNDHYMEICACNNVVIDNCNIEGVAKQDASRNYVECIQLDICEYGAFPWVSKESVMYDKTPNKNITISNCEFKNNSSSHEIYTAIGTHSIDYDNIQKNINIINCNFNNALSKTINVYGWHNVNIENCMFEDCNICLGGNLYCKAVNVFKNHFKNSNKAVEIVNGGGYAINIIDNTFECMKEDIAVLHDISSLYFKNNYLRENKGRISLKNTKSADISSNFFVSSILLNYNHVINIDGDGLSVYPTNIYNNFFGDYATGEGNIGSFDEYWFINLKQDYTFHVRQYSNNIGESYDYVIRYDGNETHLYPINKLDEFIITTAHELIYNDSFIDLDKKVNLNFRVDLNAPIQANTWTTIASTPYKGTERTLYATTGGCHNLACIITSTGVHVKCATELSERSQLRFLGVFTLK